MNECKPLQRGKILNVERKDEASMYKNTEISAMITALGLGLGGWGLHSPTSQLNLSTSGNTSLTLELSLSTLGTHPRVNLGHMVDQVSLSRADRGRVSSS